MNRIWIVLGFWLLAGNARGNEVFELTLLENWRNLDIIFSKNQKSVFAGFNYGQHSFGGGLLLKDTPVRSNSLAHLNYSYNWQITNFFRNESSLALGYFSSTDTKRESGPLGLEQPLAGAQNYLRLEFGQGKSHIYLGAGVAAVKDLMDKETNWDNLKWEAYFQNALPIWLTDFRMTSKIYDQNRYFFLKKRTLMSLKTGPNFSGKIWQFIPFIGVDADSIDNLAYARTKNYGAIFNLDISREDYLQLRGGYSQDVINQIDTATVSAALRRPNQSFEIYALLRKGETWQREKSIGIKIDITMWGSRNPNNKRQDLFSPNDYREPARQSDFYTDYGFQDDQNLTLEEQTRRLNSIRLRNEWSGVNLHYKSVSFGRQIPTDVYNSRQGDCDDQAMLNAWMDRKNGYQAYLLCYWPLNLWVAHGVEIVQDPKTGRWFFDEYGILQEIKVDRNAPLQTVAEEALKQCAYFSALPIGYHEVVYWIDEPQDDPRFARFMGWSGMNNYQSTAGKKPRLERGYELFVGPDALWR